MSFEESAARTSIADTQDGTPSGCPRQGLDTGIERDLSRQPTLSEDAHAILDAIPSPAMLIDEGQQILAVNQAMVDRFDGERSRLIGKTCAKVLHCSDDPHPKCPLEQARRADRSAEHDTFDESSDRWTRSAIHPSHLRTPEGLRIFLHIARDITDEKAAEQQAKTSAERLAVLFESAPDAYYLHDLNGSLVDGNQAAEQLVGYSKAELMGKSLFELDILPEGELPKVAEALERVVQGLPMGTQEYTLRRKDGRLVQTEMKTFPVEIQGERLVLGIARDITERKQAEAQKRELEEQLRQSQKIDAIGRLAGGVAHDFNNMLTVIKSCLMFIRESMNSLDPVLEDVEEAEKATERAVALTRQLLAFSRQQVAKPEVADLNQVVTNLEKMLRRLVGEDIRILTSLEPELRPAKIDIGHLEQVLVNLAVNSRDAMPTGGLLRIHTENFDVDQDYADRHLGMRPGPAVVISVKDTGVGMDPEVVARVFEPFFTTKAKGEGTGLGLSTAYGIVKQAGGYIQATSEPGRGSEFKIFLPVYRGEETAHDEVQSGSENQCQSARIVLVEDDPAVRRAAARILSEQGHQVQQAASVQAAIAMLEADPDGIELVVTDVVMPDMSGKDLADWIEAHQPGLPLVYMSGYTDEVIARHGVLEEGVWLLEKPFSKGAMLKIIREILATTRHRTR